MEKLSLLIFKNDCMGCHACEVACKQEHGLGLGPRLIRVIEKAPDFIPIYCHHCANAPCKEACPADAISRHEQGMVLIDEELCIGCKECIEACPFGAMQFNEDTEVAVKCDLCYEKIQNNEPPACAMACPTRCIFWGDMKTLNKEIEQRVTQEGNL
ncbi:MAG: 4Fe-4S binding protein [Deltaproteobacteria bacterium]|nr:4Fe-4S binding protein [Deltaproteobacteria bacterium]MBW2339935.1 4Fe-4S binding protein [Deltaproteobacteria bacterium]